MSEPRNAWDEGYAEGYKAGRVDETGATARNPYEPYDDWHRDEAWQEGFDAARPSDEVTGLDESPAADDEAANQWQGQYPNVSYAARVAVRLWNRVIVAEAAARPSDETRAPQSDDEPLSVRDVYMYEAGLDEGKRAARPSDETGTWAMGHIDGAHNHNPDPVCGICGVALRLWKQTARPSDETGAWERLRAIEKYAGMLVRWVDGGGNLPPWPTASGLHDLRAALAKTEEPGS